MNQEDSYSLSRAVVLIGGILAIAFGATVLGADITARATLNSVLADTGPILGVIVGVIALVASSRVKDESIDVILAVLGFLAAAGAAGVGGVLVAIGGIWAIISKYTLRAQA